MKRITVALTLSDEIYNSPRELRAIKSAMQNAGIGKATEIGSSVVALTGKIGNVKADAMSESQRDIIYIQVEAERLSQDRKWGVQDHPDGTGGAVKEELRDIAIRECDKKAAQGKCTWALILEEEFREALAETDPSKLRKELIQTIAVATAWIEAIERRNSDQLIEQ